MPFDLDAKSAPFPKERILPAEYSEAIARVKKALTEGWCQNPTGLFINSCKSGAKVKNIVITKSNAYKRWFRKQRIALAMSLGVVYTAPGEAVAVREMMQRYPRGRVKLTKTYE
ncbi:hypothetical protein I8748_17540 [Nostoc sp. CENA67]|uniref:Uncharacterized protein n=1 Tax=Amazonocrinis nigriterrae CENA67 TaxID=2794033 RepID=A0A8J7HWK1_9NOST|nr:hypothetical protein [Amazonocrinis nigriterrae]MBH8563964.1 hypothetical protein [Amazonocrinis nigriterrae CENA67]